MSLNPSGAFGLILFGFLLVYLEALRPGLVVPGVLGCMAILIGFRAWYLFQPSPFGIACLSMAALLFFTAILFPRPLIPGSLAALLLVLGAGVLVSGPDSISPVLAVSAGLPFSCLTLWLVCTAQRARRNKHSEADRP